MSEQNTINVTINGEARGIPDGLSITSLLEHLNIRKATALVEYNFNVLDRALFDETIVQPGDNLELVQFVGGG